MICSVPSGKSDSSWLDRLRSSKGFPVANVLDLEGYLNPNSDQAPTSDGSASDVLVQEKISPKLISDSAPMDTKSVAKRTRNAMDSGFTKHGKKENMFNVMNNVLGELFNMGDQGLKSRGSSEEKKSSRKQPNPRICLFTASAIVDDGRLASVQKAEGVLAMSPSSADNSVTEVEQNEYRLVPKKRGKSTSLTLVEGKSHADPSSYSCVEVTIIDTSSSIWKSGKLIFRKGNVWKVRDKRWMSGNWTAFRKKRKAGDSDKKVKVGGKKNKFGGKKKRKLSPSPFNTSEEAGRESLKNPSYENARAKLLKERTDAGSPVPKKRSKFSRSPRNLANGNSPIFRAQGIV